MLWADEAMALEAEQAQVALLEGKVAHLRSVIVCQRAIITAHDKLHTGLKKGVCDLAAENLRLVEENAALRRLLKV